MREHWARRVADLTYSRARSPERDDTGDVILSCPSAVHRVDISDRTLHRPRLAVERSHTSETLGSSAMQ